MIINLTELKRFDKIIESVENTYKKKLATKYSKMKDVASKQVKGYQSGYRKKINLTGRTIKTDLRKELRGNLEKYFSELEKKSFDSVRKDLRNVAKTKEQKIRVANISAKESRSKNKAWAKELADRQINAFETDLNKHLSNAKKLNPNITDGELKQLINDRYKVFENTRLNTTITNEANRIQNQIRAESFKESGLVRGIIFLAVLDNRTTDNCRDKNGVKIALDNPMLEYFVPPLHVNCRSTNVPILMSDKKTKLSSKSKVNRLAKEYKGILEGQPKIYR
jgi:SPP1 gp7 family putative phage head morphogenesis protein